MGSPLADKTGGLISFLASSLEEVQEIIQQDPFIAHDLIEQKWIKAWLSWLFPNHAPLLLRIGPQKTLDNCRIPNGVK